LKVGTQSVESQASDRLLAILKQISGDLGKNGYLAEIVRLVLPFFDPKRHEFLAGSNLLQAFLELGDVDRIAIT